MPTHGKYQIDSTNTNLQFHCYQFVTISQPTCWIDPTNQCTHLNIRIDIFWERNESALTDNIVQLCEECLETYNFTYTTLYVPVDFLVNISYPL